MMLHLVKLCVGVESVADLAERQARRLGQRRAVDQTPELFHRTRQMPRRRDALLGGGSLYWVIKGVIQARQELLDLRPVRCDDGVQRCDIVYKPGLVVTRPQPRRAFQGWRYLEAADAPPDLDLSNPGVEDMPARMRAELVELGLL